MLFKKVAVSLITRRVREWK
jgi:hypothetical protein